MTRYHFYTALLLLALASQVVPRIERTAINLLTTTLQEKLK